MLLFLLNLTSNNLIFNNMKTKQLLLLFILSLGLQTANAQATVASSTNTVTATNYLGSGSTSNFDVLFKRNAVNAGLLATTKTAFGVNSIAMPSSVSIGVNAGQFSSATGFNTYIGQNAGKGTNSSTLNIGSGNTFIGYNSGSINTSGSYNTYLGFETGFSNTTGANNVFMGNSSGYSCTTGINNTFNGSRAGSGNITGNNNVFLGSEAGRFQVDGNNNTYIGASSGLDCDGSNNIFLGFYAGESASGNNLLYIENSSSNSPLIWGNFASDQLKFNGKVGIGGNSTTGFGNYPSTAGGVNVSTYNLFVKGGILTEEIRVSLATTWADYVFGKNYNLKPLNEVEKFINDNGHLPNVPSAKQVEAEGINVGEMAKIQQEKIEELMLYIIAQNKRIEALEARIGK